MDIIKRAILFGGKAIVTVLDTTELAQDAINIHDLSTHSAEAVGRLLTMTAFMSGNFKFEGNKLTLIVQGDGEIGKIVASGDYGAKVRAYCENPKAGLGDNKSMREIVGKNGQLVVIRDLGLKNPYNGYSPLVNGDIATDFAYYFTTSEQLPSAVALGCLVENGKCIKNCGVIVQPMPNCGEEYLVVLEDIVNNFGDIASLMQKMSATELMEYYFGHFEISNLDDIYPQYKCTCSQERILQMILTLGYAEAMDIVKTVGKIEVGCEFCNKKYEFFEEDIKELFKEYN